MQFRMWLPNAVAWLLILVHFDVGYFCYALAAGKLHVSERQTCPSLPFVEHGTLKRISDTKVKVECDPSYMFYSVKKPSSDSPFIYCWKKNWSEPEPKCVRRPNHCLPPTAVENGQILHPKSYPADTVIQYMCDKGYKLIGPSERICILNPYEFEWSGFDPTCVEYDPSVIENVAGYLDKQFVEKMERYAVARVIDHDVEFEGLDLILLFDKSSSIHAEEFKQGIDFAKFLVGRFNVSNGGVDKKGGTRVAVYTFGNAPKPEIVLNNAAISSSEKAKQKLDTIKCANMCDGGTNLVDALALILRVFEKDSRKEAKKALFITSDGVPTGGKSQNPIDYYINKIKAKDVEIFTVGVGKDIDIGLLQQWANEPPEDHVFMLKDFEEFSEIVRIIREKQPPPPPPPVEECGYLSEKGKTNQINGTGEIKAGAWPWLAAIIKADPTTGEVAFRCNGVLICRQWVVTPAHCLYNNGHLIEPENLYVVLGEDDLSEDSGNEQYFFASEVITPDEFQLNRINDKDIGLVKLNAAARLGDYVRTACIPIPSEEYLGMVPDEEGTAIGWLITSEDSQRLPYGDITSLKASQTKLSLYGLSSCETIKPRGSSCKDMFTAGNGGMPSESCTGERGSAFQRTTSKGRQVTLGLSVYSKGCKLDSKQMMFVPLSSHQDWIKDKTKLCTDEHRKMSDEKVL